MAEAPAFIHRHFTDNNTGAYDMFRWVERTAERDGYELQVVFPENWSQLDIEKALQTVFWPEERDLRQVIDRVVNTITKAGFEARYFHSEAEADIFHDELKYLLASQSISFATEIWRCIGVKGVDLQLEPDKTVVQPISDLFMRAVEADGEWSAQEPPQGKGKARSLWQDIVRDIWRHADRAIKFSDVAATRRLTTELLLQGPSAQVNLVHFISNEGDMALKDLRQSAHIATFALDILIEYTHGTTEKESTVMRQERPINLAYTQLASVLQSRGTAYDSEAGRSYAALLTAGLTGVAYEASEELAERLGPYAGYKKQLGKVSRILRAQKTRAQALQGRKRETMVVQKAWNNVVGSFKQKGLRNCTVTGISAAADIGPLESLMTTLKLPSGGNVKIVQPSVTLALKKLSYGKEQATEIINHLHDYDGDITQAPHMQAKDIPIFTTAYDGAAQLKMIGTIQSFLSGEVHQPLILPVNATPRDIERLLLEAWQSGVVYSHIMRKDAELRPKKEKVMQEPTRQVKQEPVKQKATQHDVPKKEVSSTLAKHQSQVRELPRIRNAKTFAFKIADQRGYFTVGEYEEGAPGEIFIQLAKADVTLSGTLDALARSISHGLQHGVPLKVYVRSMMGMHFTPNGQSDDPDIPEASSIIDYMVRRMALHYLALDERIELGLDSEAQMNSRLQEKQATLV